MFKFLIELFTKKKIKMAQNHGTVKFFNKAKGYGFIKDSDSGDEIFVHATGLKDEIKQDDAVNYTISEGKKGLNAIDVKLA